MLARKCSFPGATFPGVGRAIPPARVHRRPDIYGRVAILRAARLAPVLPALLASARERRLLLLLPLRGKSRGGMDRNKWESGYRASAIPPQISPTRATAAAVSLLPNNRKNRPRRPRERVPSLSDEI